MHKYEEESKSDLKGSRNDDRFRAMQNLEKSTDLGIKQPGLESQITTRKYHHV